MEARLPHDKLLYLRGLLDIWRKKRSCTLRELQELTGFLQFASQVIPHARSFIRRLHDFASRFPSHSTCTARHIPSGAQYDIRWWSVFSDKWNGIRLLGLDLGPPIEVFTDTSGTKGSTRGLSGNQVVLKSMPTAFSNSRYPVQGALCYSPGHPALGRPLA
jgi:hypothetical protein